MGFPMTLICLERAGIDVVKPISSPRLTTYPPMRTGDMSWSICRGLADIVVSCDLLPFVLGEQPSLSRVHIDQAEQCKAG